MADVKLQVEIGAKFDELEEIQRKIIELREQIANLRKEKLQIGDPAQIKETSNRIRNLSADLGILRVEADKIRFERVNSYIQENTRVSSQAAQTLQSLNFVIRDSPYFFRDFALGILAVGNNLNPLIDNLIRLKLEAQGANMTLGQALLQTLKGPNGIILAFSAMVFVLQGLTFALSTSKQKTKEQTEEFEKQKTTVDKLVQSLLNYKQALPGFEEFEKARKDLDAVINKYKEDIKNLEKLIEERKIDLFILSRRAHPGRYSPTIIDIDELAKQDPIIQSYLGRIKELEQRINEEAGIRQRLNEVQEKYIRLTDEAHKLAKGEINLKSVIAELNKSTNAEIRLFLNYLTDLLDKTKRGTQEYTNLKEAINSINNLLKENTKATKENSKAKEDLIKNLEKEEREYLKAVQRKEKEFLESRNKELLEQINESAGTGIKKLLRMFDEEKNEKNRRILDEVRDNLKKDKAEFENWLEKYKAKLEYEELSIRNERTQLAYIRDIASSMDTLIGKGRDWFSVIANVAASIYEIAKLTESMNTGKTTSTTGTLGIISNVLSIFAAVGKIAGFFAGGGIIPGRENQAVPIIAHGGEMVLNKQQQKQLFNLIVSGNVNRPQTMTVNITGNMRANMSNLVVEFQRALKIYNNSIYYAKS